MCDDMVVLCLVVCGVCGGALSVVGSFDVKKNRRGWRQKEKRLK